MSTATAPPTLFPGESEEVLGLGADATLAVVLEEQRREHEAAARRLRAVAHWAELHRSDHVGAVDPAFRDYADRPVPGVEGELRLAGEGTFRVEEFAVCQLAAGLGMSEPAARRYVGQALELRDRLPRCWARVMTGELPAWKACQIAAETIPLGAAAAAYVDSHLAPFAAKMSHARILRAVHAAILRHEPALAADRAAQACEGRGVWLTDDIDGTSTITAVAGTPDAWAFDSALDQVALSLATLGDVEPAQARRARALGILADPQYALDLHASAELAGDGEAAGPPRRTSGPRAVPTLHVHLHTDALTAFAGSEAVGGVARVQGVGPRAVAAMERWLADLTPGAEVRVTPVVDVNERVSVSAYEAPDRLRALVEERDDGCRFPWCGRQGRYDLDHIEPYVDPDEGGPPGQTNDENVARLCRFHHRVKTHSAWRYARGPDGVLLWRSPLGHRYAVDEHGTYAQS